jgi:hypothetical protein
LDIPLKISNLKKYGNSRKSPIKNNKAIFSVLHSLLQDRNRCKDEVLENEQKK